MSAAGTDLDDLAQRAETAGLNASTPPQQAPIDGWLIRLSPGKAKRSRCVNALAEGDLPLDDLLARCTQAFKAAGLPLIVRVTPFSQPNDLDAHLDTLGWFQFDLTDVMVRATLEGLPAPAGAPPQWVEAARYAEIVGKLRGSSALEISAHAERMQQSPVRYQGFVLRGEADTTAHTATGGVEGELLACGQIAIEDGLVGLYDIFTPASLRGRGHGWRLCVALLHEARTQGAKQAYLQVSSDNHGARRLYERLGFALGYHYHYRSKDPAAKA